MPPKSDPPVPSPRQQSRHASGEWHARGLHMATPWMFWILLTVLVNVLRLVFGKVLGDYTLLTSFLAGLVGACAGAFDLHLRRNRMSLAGQLIGPLTIWGGTAMVISFLGVGYWVPLVLIWIFGGTLACLCWDFWIFGGAHHDLTSRFGIAAIDSGLGPARLMPARPRRALTAGRKPAQAPALPGREQDEGTPAPRQARPAARVTERPRREAPVQRGTIAFPGGQTTPEEGAENAVRLEGAMGYPPGALSLSPHRDNAAWANYTISDPRQLDEPEPWPGPSAPGADLAVPFRVGRWQSGQEALIPRLPLFHTRGMGQTGSAKTLGWGYNQLGEGVTRAEYAALVIDISKGEQFFGAWRPALHRFETEEDKALYLLRALHRARRARTDFLAKDHYTEWEPGCGLSFLDIFMAESPDVIALLETAKSRMASAIMSLPDWNSDVKNGRSAGMAWNLDLQLNLATEMPTVAQGQMSHLCLGVEDKKQASFGLSSRQKEGGARPELWGKRKPGMAYWDAPTLEEELVAMALRFFWWQGGSRQAAQYAQDWPSAARPLDDVTGEALEAEPGPAASLAFPVRPAQPRQDPRGAVRENVRDLFPLKPGSPEARTAAAMESEETVRAYLAERYRLGGPRRVVAFEEMTSANVWASAGRSRSWGYAAMKSMVNLGYARELEGGLKRWRILPAAAGLPEDEREEL